MTTTKPSTTEYRRERPARVVKNGQQTIELKTGGWGWQFGGGLEVWVKAQIGIFGEVSRSHLKGDGLEGSCRAARGLSERRARRA